MARWLGACVGKAVGDGVGDCVGDAVGDCVGDAVGDDVGETVGVGVGAFTDVWLVLISWSRLGIMFRRCSGDVLVIPWQCFGEILTMCWVWADNVVSRTRLRIEQREPCACDSGIDVCVCLCASVFVSLCV